MRMHFLKLFLIAFGMMPLFASADGDIVPPATYPRPASLKPPAPTPTPPVIVRVPETTATAPLPAPIPPPKADEYANVRAPWYIGFGVGNGLATYAENGVSRSNALDTVGFGFLNFKVGATLSQRLLLGYDMTALYLHPKAECYDTALVITNHNAMLTWFPWRDGIFLRGGGGLTLAIHRNQMPGEKINLDIGGNVLAGAGYAFPLGTSTHLTVNADYSLQRYGGGEGKPTQSQFVALWLGLDWY